MTADPRPEPWVRCCCLPSADHEFASGRCREPRMTEKLNVITGATGLLGSHVAEQLVARGERVRTLVRRDSNIAFLQQLGVELAWGDLQDPNSLREAFAGADVVYHCAAKVGEWGPRSV